MDMFLRPLFQSDDGGVSGAVMDAAAKVEGDAGDGATEPDASAQPAPDAGGKDEGSGEKSTGWLSNVKSAHHEALQELGYESLDDVVTDAIGLRKSSVPKLGDEPTDEEVARYREVMGIPDAPEGYEYEHIERYSIPIIDSNGREAKVEANITDTLGGDFDEWFSKTAHELELSAEQAKKFHQAYQKQTASRIMAAAEERRTQTAEQRQRLIDEHGEAEMHRRLESGRQSVAMLDPEGAFNKRLGQAGLLSDPAWINFAMNLARWLSPETLTRAGAGEGGQRDRYEPGMGAGPETFRITGAEEARKRARGA